MIVWRRNLVSPLFAAGALLLFSCCASAGQSPDTIAAKAVEAAERAAVAAEGQLSVLWYQSILSGLGAAFGLVALCFSIYATVSTARTSRRELRAYLQTQVYDEAFDTSHSKIWVKITNVGQTPAYRVTPVGAVMLRPHPLSDVSEAIIKRASRLLTTPETEMTIGAGVSVSEDRPLRLDAHQVAQVLRGDLVVVYFGRVQYRDAFGKRHITSFCHKYYLADGQWMHEYHVKGNHAD